MCWYARDFPPTPPIGPLTPIALEDRNGVAQTKPDGGSELFSRPLDRPLAFEATQFRTRIAALSFARLSSQGAEAADVAIPNRFVHP